MTQQITVAEIISPQPGKKQYKVIDQAGQQWGVWADHITEYTVGGVYDIIRHKSNIFQGKTYYTIEESQYLGMSQELPIPQPPQRVVAGPVRRAPPRPNGSTYVPAPRPPQPTADKTRSMEIFVCGALNNILSNPNVNPMSLTTPDLISLVNRLSATWRNTLGTEQRDGEMNDEIPI